MTNCIHLQFSKIKQMDAGTCTTLNPTSTKVCFQTWKFVPISTPFPRNKSPETIIVLIHAICMYLRKPNLTHLHYYYLIIVSYLYLNMYVVITVTCFYLPYIRCTIKSLFWNRFKCIIDHSP